jgi:hypothetical protein
MAKVIEQVIAIKLSRIVKDSDTRESVLDSSQNENFVNSLPEIVEEVINDSGIIAEVIQLD